MKSIRFTTKEETNREREEAFMALSGVERLAWFFSNVGRTNVVSEDLPEEKSDNWVLYRRTDESSLG